MVNKSKRRTKRKMGVSPLMRQMPRVQRPRMNFNGQLLEATKIFDSSVTVATISKDYQHLSANVIYGVMSAATDIVKFYSTYKVRYMRMEWLPFVGPGSADAGSRVYIAYNDNPERGVAFAAAVPALGLTYIKANKNARVFNAWERFTFNVPVTNRRKLFDIDITDATVSADDWDRTVQGDVQIAQESVSAAVLLGQWRVTYGVELHGLILNATT